MTRPGTPGPWFALPLIVFFSAFFVAPIIIVFWYSLMPARTFDLGMNFTFENYLTIFRDGYGRPLMWSLIGAALTTLTCLLFGLADGKGAEPACRTRRDVGDGADCTADLHL